MLVLTRKETERTRLIDNRTGQTLGWVEVVQASGARARIGFDFPMHIGVRREELPDLPPAGEAAA